jgi:hypothetical protein
MRELPLVLSTQDRPAFGTNFADVPTNLLGNADGAKLPTNAGGATSNAATHAATGMPATAEGSVAAITFPVIIHPSVHPSFFRNHLREA